MPYDLAGVRYPTKQAITERCRDILNATPNGQLVRNPEDVTFLLAVFAHHSEWPQKSAQGCDAISTARSPFYNTRFFTLISHGELVGDISYPHAIKNIPTRRNAQPQALTDFRNAARAAVRDQIDAFRASSTPVCALTGTDLSQSVQQMHVDHEPAFDQLLFDFCCAHHINPLHVCVVEVDTVPVFQSAPLSLAWQDYHRQHAGLRILSRTANLSRPKARVDWSRAFLFHSTTGALNGRHQ